jgi:hypothetical protein
MIIRSEEGWNIVLDRLLSGPIGLVCDGFRVLIMVSIDTKSWKAYIKPIVNGVYFPYDWGWLKDDESYHACDLPYTPFYYEKRRYIYSQSQKAKWKRKLSKKTYEKRGYNRYLYRYSDFTTFNAFKNQYIKNFDHIELFENTSEAFIDDSKALPGKVGNPLRGTGKALPETVEGEIIDA